MPTTTRTEVPLLGGSERLRRTVRERADHPDRRDSGPHEPRFDVRRIGLPDRSGHGSISCGVTHAVPARSLPAQPLVAGEGGSTLGSLVSPTWSSRVAGELTWGPGRRDDQGP